MNRRVITVCLSFIALAILLAARYGATPASTRVSTDDMIGGKGVNHGPSVPVLAPVEDGHIATVPFATALEQVPAALVDAVGGRVYSCPRMGTGLGRRVADADDPLDFAAVPRRGDRLLLPAHDGETRVVVDFEGHGQAEFELSPINSECQAIKWTPFSAVQGFVVDTAGVRIAGVPIAGCGGTAISGADGSFLIEPVLVGKCKIGVVGCDSKISEPVEVVVGPHEDLLDVHIVTNESAMVVCATESNSSGRDCAYWQASRTRKIVEAHALARSNPPEGVIYAELVRDLEAADEEMQSRCGDESPVP